MTIWGKKSDYLGKPYSEYGLLERDRELDLDIFGCPEEDEDGAGEGPLLRVLGIST